MNNKVIFLPLWLVINNSLAVSRSRVSQLFRTLFLIIFLAFYQSSFAGGWVPYTNVCPSADIFDDTVAACVVASSEWGCKITMIPHPHAPPTATCDYPQVTPVALLEFWSTSAVHGPFGSGPCGGDGSWDTTSQACIGQGIPPGNDPGDGCTSAFNPINFFSGNKHQQEVIYEGGALLRFLITYNSKFVYTSGTKALYQQWVQSYSQSIEVATATSPSKVTVSRNSGQKIVFYEANGSWAPDSNIKEKLVEIIDGAGNRSGWVFTTVDDDIESYDRDGKLLSITDKSGLRQSIVYTSTLTTITEDVSGRALQLQYDSIEKDKLLQLIDPDGNVFIFEYDTENRLSAIIFSDDTPSNQVDNPRRIFHYENTLLLYALTGITDELGNRFATWAYDTEGRAISSHHAGSANQGTLDYSFLDDPIDPRVTTTNSLGKSTTYHYTTINGIRKISGVEGHASANCAAANRSYSYDPNGFTNEVTDWKGNIVDYDYDSRGLEVKRIEAKGTPEQRVISTEWHATFNLPTKITKPDRETTFTYDANGNQLTKVVTDVPL
jgi:YD repeat-containing protein